MSEALHVLALAAWLGTVGMTGVVAAVIFPQMHILDPTLGGYPKYTGDHWLLAAGQIAAKIFAIGDKVQLVCAGTAGLTLVAALFARRFTPVSISGVLRLIGLLVAFGALTYQTGSVGPEMRRNLDAYWMAAQDGRNDDAAFSQALFQESHPKASRTLSIAAGGVLVALLTGAWSLSKPVRLVPVPVVEPEYGDE